MPHLAAVATASPAHELDQSFARDAAEQFFARGHPDLERILTVFENSGVQRRRIARPPEWYLAKHGWKERTQAFHETGLALLEEATTKALAKAGLARDDIDGLVMVTSTGISTPSLDARLANRLGLKPGILRVPLWGLGCAGGVAGLARAGDLATAHPDKRFLLLSLELCSLAFLRDRFDKKLLVAASLFGDGCGAAILEGDGVAQPDRPRWAGGASHQWRDTEWVMGWDVVDEGLDVIFDPAIPKFVRANVGEPTRAFLAGRDVDAYAFHPGGAKVLDALAHALDLRDDDLRYAREVLRDHGNMSSPTVLYVLERILNDRPKTGRVLAAALGPGFAQELALFEDGAA